MILSYLGSKASLLYNLTCLMSPYITEQTRFCDLFSGSGIVSQFFRNKCNVTSCDQEFYSYVLCYALTKSTYNTKLKKIISCFNISSPQCVGLVSQHFAPPKRMFFTQCNAQKIDYCRKFIDKLYKENTISYDEFMFLLASLLCSASKISNTCGTFRAYLKTFSKKALQPFKLCPIHLSKSLYQMNNVVVCKHVNICLRTSEYDVIYLDPPYNNIHYGAYYSFLNYLCIYSPDQILQGTGICSEYNKSKFGMKKTARQEFLDMFNTMFAKQIFMSYGSNGILEINELVDIIRKSKLNKCMINIYRYDYKPYKTKQVHINSIIEYVVHIDVLNSSNITTVHDVVQRH